MYGRDDHLLDILSFIVFDSAEGGSIIVEPNLTFFSRLLLDLGP